jgi:NADH dehydrogenase
VSGVKANAITGIDSSHLGRGGRIIVDQYNRIEGLDGIFAIGDQCIMTADPNYPNGHPQLAQPSIQQAVNLAKNIKKMLKGDNNLTPFRYKNLGSMATVGRNKAVADIEKIHTQGFIAWMLWLVVHLRSILGIRNKIVVLLNWVWNYITYDNSIRMIVFAKKAKEVREREERERVTHLGTDLLGDKNLENTAN